MFGYTGGYSFLANGNWTGALGPMAGLNDSTDFFGTTDTMTFSFATPVSAVGGLLNYVPGSFNPATIAVWDSNGNLIESYDLLFVTSGADDTSAFYGFQETSANISSFTLTDNYIGITSLTTGVHSRAEFALVDWHWSAWCGRIRSSTLSDCSFRLLDFQGGPYTVRPSLLWAVRDDSPVLRMERGTCQTFHSYQV